MKKILFIILISISVLRLYAQSGNDTLPKFYLGLGTGINSYTGLLGLSGNLRIHDRIFIQGGLGLGSWGSKITIGIRYDMTYGSGWCYGIGISSCSGLKDFKNNMELQSGLKKDVTMNLYRANTLNLKATRNWTFHRRNTFYLDLGYAIPLQASPWEVTDGSLISNNSRAAMNLISPGGLILGLGITFGL